MDQKGLKVDSYCFIFYFYLIYQSESLLPWAYLPEPLLLFFLFLSVPPTSPELAFYTNWLCIFSLFISCVVCLFVSYLCLCRPPVLSLSWAGLLQQVTLCLVALFLFLMLFVYLYLVSVPTCPELVCECDPMLWLLSSRRTLSNVGILPFDLHTFDFMLR